LARSEGIRSTRMHIISKWFERVDGKTIIVEYHHQFDRTLRREPYPGELVLVNRVGEDGTVTEKYMFDYETVCSLDWKEVTESVLTANYTDCLGEHQIRSRRYPKPTKPEPNRDFEHTPPSAVRAIFG
jgi:hypothetical protein